MVGESVHCDYGHDLCLYRALFYTDDLLYSTPAWGLICALPPYCKALESVWMTDAAAEVTALRRPRCPVSLSTKACSLVLLLFF